MILNLFQKLICYFLSKRFEKLKRYLKIIFIFLLNLLTSKLNVKLLE